MQDDTSDRRKYPDFIRYANFHEEFSYPSDAHYETVWRLVSPFWPRLEWRWGYTPEKAQQELGAHQPIFRAILSGIMDMDLTPDQQDMIRLHVGHFAPHARYDPSPDQSFLDVKAAEDVEWYQEIFEPRDPLDPLYYQVRLFLRNRSPQELRKCRSCGHYFLAVTPVRRPNYCQDPCPIQVEPVLPEVNLKYQRTSRRKQEINQRKRVHQAIERLHERLIGQKNIGTDDWRLEDVPEDLLMEVVLEEICKEVNKKVAVKLRLGEQSINAIIGSGLDADAQQRMLELTRRATPQYTAYNDHI